MDTSQQLTRGARVLGPNEGEVAGAPESRTDRFMIDGADTGGRLSVVEHILPPHVLAGPLHYHSREDEYSYMLEGRLGALLGDQEVYAQAGDLVFKPRGQWHTFWNPGDTPTRILELIIPAGLEDLFRELGTPASTWTRRRCRRWRHATAARSTSRARQPSSSGTGCGSRRRHGPRSANPRGTGDAAGGRLRAPRPPGAGPVVPARRHAGGRRRATRGPRPPADRAGRRRAVGFPAPVRR